MPYVSVRLESVDSHFASKQRKHDLRERVPDYVDKSRSHLNRVLISPPSAKDLRAECERRCAINGRRGLQRNAAIGIRGIITFSTDAVLPDDTEIMDAHFRNTAKAIADKIGTTVAGLVVHLDESRPHAHFLLHNYGLNGLSVGRKLRPRTLSEIQDLAGECWKDLGLSRGKRKADRIKDGEPRHKYIHRTVSQLHNDLPRELEDISGRIEKMREIVKRKPPPKPREVEVIENGGIFRRKTKRIQIMPLDEVQKWARSILADAAAREKAAEVKRAMADIEYKNARDILNRAVDLSQRVKHDYQAEANSLRDKLPPPVDKPADNMANKPRMRG